MQDISRSCDEQLEALVRLLVCSLRSGNTAARTRKLLDAAAGKIGVDAAALSLSSDALAMGLAVVGLLSTGTGRSK